MARLWGYREVWLILHIFLLLPVLGRTCFTRSAESSPEEICDILPMLKCHITTCYMEDTVCSNYTVLKCPDYDQDPSTTFHWSLNSCCSGDYDDPVVNLTSGVKTNIDCSLAPILPPLQDHTANYAWRMEAPSGLRVLLTVPRHHVSNIIEATDEDDRGNPYIFAANCFAEDGDYFLASSNVVYMKATLEGSDPTNFTVIAEVVSIIDTIEVTGDPMNCTVPSHAGENHWDIDTSYHGTTPNDKGCAAFEGTLPADITDSDDCILIKFSYYIKTFEGSDISGAAMLWKGTYIIPCNPSNVSLSSQSKLKMKVSCIVSFKMWAVNIQASGVGLVKISDMQLLMRGTTVPITVSPVPSSTTLVSTISSPTSPSQRVTVASTDMTRSVGTAFSSSSPTSTTSPSSSSSMSKMTRSLTTRPSTYSIDIHSSRPPINATESSKSQDRSSGRNKSVIPVVVVLLIVLLIALIVGVFWYKRRGKLATSKQNQQPRSPNGIVQNPTFQNDDGKHEYGEYSEKPSTKGTTRISSSEDAQQHIYSDLSASKDNNGVIYNEVGEQDYNVPFGGKEMGDYHEYNLPDSDHGRSNAKKPTNEDSYQELSEDGKRCNSPKGTQGNTRISSSGDALQHIYSDLHASASKDNNDVIYNEVGEQDYNVPFGGKEMGDYHEYNLPDSDHGRSNAKKPTNEDSYQELSEDGKRCSPKETKRHALPGMAEKAIESQPKVGDPSRTGGHAYQDLRKDDGGYTSLQNSLGLPQKPVTKLTAAELENSYQALHADGPDYFTLETNETKPSPNPDNLQNSTHQPLRQEPEYSTLESEQSDNPAKPEDNNYQSLLKDANNHADLDTEHRNDNPSKQDQSDPYDVLQRGPKTKQLSSDGYGSLGPTAKEEEEHEYASQEDKPKSTTDYEDPIQDNSVADAPYDSLQRKPMPEPPRSSPSLANQAEDVGDDDYETPGRSNDDPTDATYQTLDNQQEKSDSGNEEYSHLQRSLGAKLSHDPSGVSDDINQYGKLCYGNSAAK